MCAEGGIYGVGTDLCQAARMERCLQRDAFLRRVFSEQEQTLLAARSGKARWDQRSGREEAVSGWPGWQPKEEFALDNTPSAYAEEAVAWAVENGLLYGNAQGDLMLSQPVTRQQLLVILHRFAQLEGRR